MHTHKTSAIIMMTMSHFPLTDEDVHCSIASPLSLKRWCHYTTPMEDVMKDFGNILGMVGTERGVVFSLK